MENNENFDDRREGRANPSENDKKPFYEKVYNRSTDRPGDQGRDGGDRFNRRSDAGHDDNRFNRRDDRSGYDRSGYDRSGNDRSGNDRSGNDRPRRPYGNRFEESSDRGFNRERSSDDRFNRRDDAGRDDAGRDDARRSDARRDAFDRPRRPYGDRNEERGERSGFGRSNRREEPRGERGFGGGPSREESRNRFGDERGYGDRSGNDRSGSDRSGNDRGGFNRRGDDRRGFERRDDFDRPRRPYGDRNENQFNRRDDDRSGNDRSGSDRSGNDRSGYARRDDNRNQDRYNRRSDERPERPYGNRYGERSSYNRSGNDRGGDDRRGFERRDDAHRGDARRNDARFNRQEDRGGYNRRDDARGSDRSGYDRSGYYRGGDDRPRRQSFRSNDEQPDRRGRDRFERRDEPSAGALRQPNYRLDRLEERYPRIKKQEHAEPKKENDGTIRLNRYIANAGVCSRRDADVLIANGEITVNGQVVTEMGHKVKPDDVVKYGGKVLSPEKMTYVLLNKPKDYITTTDDPNDRHTVMELVADATPYRIYPVGRLDRNTTGLLLLTNDGELADKLTHPSNNIKKIYQVELDKPITTEHFEAIKEGIELEDGFIKPDDLGIVTPDAQVVGIEIHSGRNRIVRRIFEHLGYEVTKLDRTVYAGLTKKELPRGKWRYLSEKEVIRLKFMQ